MKFLQLGFIVLLGGVCFATYATSSTLHSPCQTAEQAIVLPAPTGS